MTEQEKIFTIPLRRHFRIYPRWRRTKVAVRATREFLQHHLKTEEVKLGKFLNLELHAQGRKQPPAQVKVKVWKEKDVFFAEIIGAPQEKEPEGKTEKKTEKPEVTKSTKEETIKEEVMKKPEAPKVKPPKPEVKRKVKGAEKRGEMEHHKEVFPKDQKPG